MGISELIASIEPGTFADMEKEFCEAVPVAVEKLREESDEVRKDEQ